MEFIPTYLEPNEATLLNMKGRINLKITVIHNERKFLSLVTYVLK